MGGIQLQEGADPDLLFKLYPMSAVIPLWEQFEPIVMFIRKGINDPRMWEPFEYLYYEAKKRAPELTGVDLSTVRARQPAIV